MPRIHLSIKEMKVCWEFSLRSAENQQEIEFGQADTQPRPVNEIARDNFIGKLAEAAFQKFLRENYSINIELDFNYYPRRQWDDQDALINGWIIDVKGTRTGSRWFLIELNKLEFRRNEGRLPDFFVSAVVGWDRKADEALGFVDIMGYTHIDEIKPGATGTVYIKKGDPIPGTQTKMQADNFGRRFTGLNSDWDKFVGILHKRKS